MLVLTVRVGEGGGHLLEKMSWRVIEVEGFDRVVADLDFKCNCMGEELSGVKNVKG